MTMMEVRTGNKSLFLSLGRRRGGCFALKASGKHDPIPMTADTYHVNENNPGGSHMTVGKRATLIDKWIERSQSSASVSIKSEPGKVAQTSACF